MRVLQITGDACVRVRGRSRSSTRTLFPTLRFRRREAEAGSPAVPRPSQNPFRRFFYLHFGEGSYLTMYTESYNVMFLVRPRPESDKVWYGRGRRGLDSRTEVDEGSWKVWIDQSACRLIGSDSEIG